MRCKEVSTWVEARVQAGAKTGSPGVFTCWLFWRCALPLMRSLSPPRSCWFPGALGLQERECQASMGPLFQQKGDANGGGVQRPRPLRGAGTRPTWEQTLMRGRHPISDQPRRRVKAAFARQRAGPLKREAGI